jgi:hypothetical protein
MKELLANIIWIIHLTLVIFLVTTPFFVEDELILLIHVLGGLCLILHWKMNNNECVLTYLEGLVRGCTYDTGFLHTIIGPIYNVGIDSNLSLVVFILCIFSVKKLNKKKDYFFNKLRKPLVS